MSAQVTETKLKRKAASLDCRAISHISDVGCIYLDLDICTFEKSPLTDLVSFASFLPYTPPSKKKKSTQRVFFGGPTHLQNTQLHNYVKRKA